MKRRRTKNRGEGKIKKKDSSEKIIGKMFETAQRKREGKNKAKRVMARKV